MEIILLSLYIALYVPLMKTAATCSTIVMLNLTEEGHKLEPPVGCHNTREFLIPTQLHELFCWVHQLKPLDLMDEPWSNYHLEMQLFWDTNVIQRSPVFCVIEDLITERTISTIPRQVKPTSTSMSISTRICPNTDCSIRIYSDLKQAH